MLPNWKLAGENGSFFVDFSLLPIARVRGIYSVLKFGLLVSFPSTKYALIVNALFWVVSLHETYYLGPF